MKPVDFKIVNLIFLKNSLILKETVPGCDVSY